MPVFPFPVRDLGRLERVLLVALLVPVLLLTVAATVPALVVLPFLPGGCARAVQLLRTHTAAIAALLRGSRTRR